MSGLTIGGSGEVRVIGTSRVLNRNSNRITPLATVTEVIVLEIEGFLIETVAVRYVVNGVDEIKGIDASSINVGGGCRLRCCLLRIDKLSRGALLASCTLAALVSDRIVTTVYIIRIIISFVEKVSHSRGIVGITDPAAGRGFLVFGISESFKAFVKGLLRNGENSVCGLGDEVGNGNKFVGVSINECFIPRTISLDLYDMGQSHRSVVFGEVFNRRWDVVIFPGELPLRR